MNRAVGLLAIVGVSAGIAGAATVACSVDPEHIYSGRLLEAPLMCLDPYTAIDVISGGDTGGGCDPVCLIEQTQYYISQQCPPYPPLFVVVTLDAGDAADPTCTSAFQAMQRGDTCDLEGGVIHGDGGDAGGDATTDAGAIDSGDASVTIDATADAINE